MGRVEDEAKRAGKQRDGQTCLLRVNTHRSLLSDVLGSPHHPRYHGVLEDGVRLIPHLC